MDELRIVRYGPGDARVSAFWRAHWHDEIMVAHGSVFRASELPAVVIEERGEWLGLATYHIDAAGCEILSLDSLREGRGIGTRLIAAVAEIAREAGCGRLWLITTNDNTAALRFYQRRGFGLCALRVGTVAAARAIKPTIPLLGNDDIPIRDELELELRLEDGGGLAGVKPAQGAS